MRSAAAMLLLAALALIGSTTLPTPTPRPTQAALSSTSEATETVDSACDFAQAVSADVRAIDGRGGTRYTTEIDDTMRDAFAPLHGFGLWQDGANGTYGDFTAPDDLEPVAWLQLTMADDSTRWVWLNQSPTTPGHIYAFVFTSLVPTTDAEGAHLGQHNLCATVDVPLDAVRVLFSGPRHAVTAAPEITANFSSQP